MVQPRSIPFGSRRIGPGHPVVVIAEIGINHEGDVATCGAMIEAAAKAGADAVKLQTMDAEQNYVRGTESHRLFSQSALSREDTAAMFALARSLGIEVFTTAGDAATIAWVDRLNPAAHKISSGLLTNVTAVRCAARTGRALLMSTGMAEAAEIDEALDTARDAGATEICLLQCTSLYPTPREHLNLGAIRWLESRYNLPVGFSDHSLGSSAAALAVAVGAHTIEKHFTLDTRRPGYDHPISLDPAGFMALVRGVRDAEAVVGAPTKVMAPNERAQAPRFRRIVVAARDIAAGEALSETNLALKRPLPGTAGFPPRDIDKLLGKRARRSLRRDEALDADAVEA